MPSLHWLSKIFLVLLVLVTCAISLLLATTFRYNRSDSYAKVYTSVETQMSHVEWELRSVNRFLVDLLFNNANVGTISTTDDINTRNTASRTLWDILQYQNTIRNENSFSLLLYFPEESISILNRAGNASYESDMQVQQLVKESIDNGTILSNTVNWETLVVGEYVYLTQCYQKNDAYACGWIRCDRFISFFVTSQVYQQASCVFLDENNQPLLAADVENLQGITIENHKVQGKASRDYFLYSLNYSYLSLLFSDDVALDYPRIFLFTGLYLLLLSAISGYYLYTMHYYRRNIQMPLNALQQRISSYVTLRKNAKRKGFAELEEANEVFDTLTEQIDELRIDFYEEQLLRTRTELDYYQLQIKPHFFINCLNIIFSMVQKAEYGRIQDFCLCLSRYIRYLFSNTFDVVPLQDELTHLSDYLQIIAVRHRADPTLLQSISPSVLACKIPPLLLSTFVENSIQYSKQTYDKLVIKLSAEVVTKDGKSYIHIILQDNGLGFPHEVLKDLNNFHRSKQSGSVNIGISNIQRRLLLLYGEQASVVFYNGQQSGACVEITFPMQVSADSPNPVEKYI